MGLLANPGTGRQGDQGPINPHTGKFASTTDAGTWADLETAHTFAADSASASIGFVFTDDDPFVGVNLDDCRVPATETL